MKKNSTLIKLILSFVIALGSIRGCKHSQKPKISSNTYELDLELYEKYSGMYALFFGIIVFFIVWSIIDPVGRTFTNNNFVKTKVCDNCKKSISKEASKCPYCTSDLS